MNIEVINTEYIDNQRIDTVKHTYNKSDDYVRLGQLYFTYGQKLALKERQGLKSDDGMSSEQAGLLNEIRNLESLITAQLAIIAGYS